MTERNLDLEHTQEDRIIIHTDGACSGNPGPGGWGAVIEIDGDVQEISGGEIDTTNNRMELLAAIKGILHLRESADNRRIDIYTDSKYLQDGVNKWLANWKRNNWITSAKKAVKNQDLWQEIDKLTNQYNIIWHWVKAHDGNEMNERADSLARTAIIAKIMEDDAS